MYQSDEYFLPSGIEILILVLLLLLFDVVSTFTVTFIEIERKRLIRSITKISSS